MSTTREEGIGLMEALNESSITNLEKLNFKNEQSWFSEGEDCFDQLTEVLRRQ